ncbi:transposase [Streptomyces sp. NPDC059749]|uniref:transposase n=1 Tax=Streptomyces sp. NPDC059749 TaxID=3346931 RepID=UPI0036491EDE
MRGSPPQHTTYHVHGEPAASEVLRDRIDHELGWTGRRTPLRGRPGRSRGGFTAKVHLSVDGRCRPLPLLVMPGQRADCTQFTSVPEKIRFPRHGRGRQLKKPQGVAADKAYSNGPCRRHLRHRGIPHTIPEKADSQAARLRKGSRGGRPPGFDEERYKKRTWVSGTAHWPLPTRPASASADWEVGRYKPCRLTERSKRPVGSGLQVRREVAGPKSRDEPSHSPPIFTYWHHRPPSLDRSPSAQV